MAGDRHREDLQPRMDSRARQDVEGTERLVKGLPPMQDKTGTNLIGEDGVKLT